MRIGIDISKALGRPDGIGRYTRGLVAALMAEDREGDYRLYPLFEAAAAPDRFREVFPEAPAGFRLAHQRAPAPGEVDLFHATTLSVPREHLGPLVVTVYDLTFLTHPRCHTLDNRTHCLAGLARALCCGARIIAISRHTRRELVERLAVPGDRVTVVYPAADARFAPTPDPAVPARLGLPGPYLLSLGTLEPRKNFPAVVEAFARLPGEVRGEHLLAVAGAQGWLAPDLEARAREAGVADRVRFLGPVDDGDLPALYSGAAAFVYPSLAEGFGLPPLEAMACGAPVVASSLTSLPEVVGEAGLLVDPREPEALAGALAGLLGDPGRRSALSKAGQERAATFSWRRAARETLAVYRQAAGEPALPPDAAPGAGEPG